MQAIHTTESYSEIRKKILTLILTITGINIESFRLRGKSQTREITCCSSLRKCLSRVRNQGSGCLDLGNEVYFQGHESILELITVMII